MGRASDSSGSRANLDEVLANYMRRIDSGEQIDEAGLIAEYPEHAGELRNYFSCARELPRIARDDDPTIGFDPPGVRPSATPEIGSVLGGFRLDDVLGEGGQGIVYRARDLAAERDVAVKLLSDANSATRDVLLNEAKQAAKLRHENIVPLLYVTPASDSPFFAVLEYVDGITLAELIRTEAPLPEEAALLVVRDIAAALAHAHGQGVVHLDVKPANVLVERTTGRARLSDFGMAVQHAERRTRSTGGTFAYMAPEQIEQRSEQFDGRTDIWAVGCVFYEMLTAQRPFGGAGIPTNIIAEEIATIQPMPPSQWNPSVSSRCDSICLRCLEKDISKRFPSAARLLEEVEAALSLCASPQHPESATADEEAGTKTSKATIAIGGCLVAATAAACVLLVVFGIIEADEMKHVIQRLMRAFMR